MVTKREMYFKNNPQARRRNIAIKTNQTCVIGRMGLTTMTVCLAGYPSHIAKQLI